MLAAASLLALSTLPTTSAEIACVGYQACYQATGDGWAILCVFLPAPNVALRCVDLVCESCGNIGRGLGSADVHLEVLP